MIKKKRAEGLSINVIIIAIIGLVVLVVLVFIFNRGTGESVKTLQSCGGRGGECRAESEGCKAYELNIRGEDLCPEDKPICCKEIYK